MSENKTNPARISVPRIYENDRYYNGYSENEIGGRHFQRSEVENVEAGIFLDRLTGIFEMLMSKMEFAATLPTILSNTKVLKMLKPEDSKQVLAAFAQFSCFERNSESGSDTSTQEKSFIAPCNFGNLKNLSCNEDKYINSNSGGTVKTCSSIEDYSSLHHGIEILYSCGKIRELAKQCESEISKPTLNFLRQLKFFLEFILSKAKLTPEQEREKTVRARQTIRDIDRAKLEISELTDSLEKQKLEHETEEKELLKKLYDALETWDRINQEYNNDYEKILRDSENESIRSMKEFSARMQSLEETLSEKESKLASQKAKNNKIESELLMKKFKVESQLSSLIGKFDTDVAEMREAFGELEKEYRALEDEKNGLTEEMNAQAEIYEGIVREREEKELAEFKATYDSYVRNRCARVIQRWWRTVLLFRRKRKKKKKNKKAKK